MAGYFLDTSALVKLYHTEPGSDYVELIFRRSRGSCFVSTLSLVEIESAFAIKTRARTIDDNRRLLAIRNFSTDLSRGWLTLGPPLKTRHLSSANMLLRRHGVSLGLRTLDAIQMAVALELQASSAIFAMVSADRALCQVAEACGCPAIDPTNPGPMIQL